MLHNKPPQTQCPYTIMIPLAHTSAGQLGVRWSKWVSIKYNSNFQVGSRSSPHVCRHLTGRLVRTCLSDDNGRGIKMGKWKHAELATDTCAHIPLAKSSQLAEPKVKHWESTICLYWGEWQSHMTKGWNSEGLSPGADNPMYHTVQCQGRHAGQCVAIFKVLMIAHSRGKIPSTMKAMQHFSHELDLWLAITLQSHSLWELTEASQNGILILC